MKKLFIVILLSIPIIVFAQKKQRDTAKVIYPMIDGSIVFERIIDSLNQNKSKLFESSLKWMANTFVDSKEVIQIKDQEKGNIVGAGVFDYTSPGFTGGAERMAFMTDISVKDNKARIRLYQFRYMFFGSGGYKTVSSDNSGYLSFDEKYKQYLAEKQYPLMNKKLFALLDEKIKAIINSYGSFLKSNSKPDDF